MVNEVAEWYNAHRGCGGRVPLEKTGSYRPVVLGEVMDGGYRQMVGTIYSKGGTPRQVVFTSAHLMTKGDWFIPECKMVNGSDMAGYYAMAPDRQFSKALRHFGAKWFSGGLPQGPHYGAHAELLWAWRKPYPGFNEALQSVLLGERISCAFDKYWAVGARYGLDDPVLYHRDDVIGKITQAGNIHIPAYFAPFREFLEKVTQKGVVYE